MNQTYQSASPLEDSSQVFSAQGKRILVIEDDPDISHLLAIHLQDNAYQVDVVSQGNEGLQRALKHDYALIVLDLMLPGLDGLEICRALRQQSIDIPILMLTAKSSELDRVLGLELGADDYLTKPFSILELQARVKAILRRTDSGHRPVNDENPETLESRGLSVNIPGRQVSVNRQAIELTAKEFDLLLHFVTHPGRVFSRCQLLDQVWGYTHSGYEHTVNSHINRLRKKLGGVPGQPEYIETVWGVGYRYSDS